MPFPNLSRTTQRRAITQANANTESNEAVVTRTYADALGNIIAADVQVKGSVKALVQVPNASGIKLYKGASVEMRTMNGSKHFRQITGPAGTSTAAAANAAALPPASPSLSTYAIAPGPILLQSPDAGDMPGGYVEAPGANVLFTDTPPGMGSGGMVNGQRLITMRPLVATSLPNALTTTLPDGTLLDLIDSYSNPLGMYRLDAGAKVWRRRDVGTAGSTFTLLPATAALLGGVKIGANVSVAADGTISVAAAPVTSVAGRTGAVTLSNTDISGLGSAATQPASAFDGAGAAAAAQAASLQKSANLSDLANAGTARTNLGLGTAATANVPATGNATSAQVVLGSDTRLGAGGFAPGSVQAPTSVGFDHADYSGSTELITWRARNTAAYSAGAIEFYGWQTSPDNSAWTTEAFGGDTYQGVGVTSGSQYARVRAYPLVTSGGAATPSAWVGSSVQAYATNPAASGLSVTESVGSGPDQTLTTTYATIPNISLSVAANQAVDVDGLVELTADASTGTDDLYVQLYDSIAAAAIANSERHISYIPAGKRGLVTVEKVVPGIAGGRMLVLQARNGTAARGSVSSAKSLLQMLSVSSATSSGTGTQIVKPPAGTALKTSGTTLINNLVLALPINEGSGTTIKDWVSGNTATLGSGWSWVTNNGFPTIQGSGSQSVTQFTPVTQVTGDCTLLAIGFSNDPNNTGTTDNIFFGQGTSAWSYYCATNGTVYIDASGGAGQTSHTAPTGMITLASVKSGATLTDYNLASGSAVSLATATDSTSPTMRTQSPGVWLIGSGVNTSRQLNGYITALFFWNRALTSAELNALAADPYQMFQGY